MDEIKSFLKSRTICNLLIVAANVLVFLVMEVLGNTEDVEFMLMHGACYSPWVFEYGEYYRLFTSMFLHYGIEHLIFNMLLLIFLGDALEQEVGKVRYLIIYLGGGLCGNILSCFLDYHGSMDFAVSAGASGAVFATVGALLYIVLRNGWQVQGLSGIQLIVLAVLTVVQGFTSEGVDNAAHVGGFLAGLLLAVILYHKRRDSSPKAEEPW